MHLKATLVSLVLMWELIADESQRQIVATMKRAALHLMKWHVVYVKMCDMAQSSIISDCATEVLSCRYDILREEARICGHSDIFALFQG